MKKIISLAAVLAGALALSACGQKVDIPPGYVGKILTPKGYKEQIIPPSKTRLDFCWSYCDKLILLQSSDIRASESMKIFMPEDKLELGTRVELGLTLNPEKYNYVFDKVPPKDVESRVGSISVSTAYDNYAAHIIKTQTREFLTKFTIAEVSSNMETINKQLTAHLTETLEKKTPFIVRYVGLTEVKYPSIITAAQEASAERREQIEKEEANLRVVEIRLENQLKEAQLQRKIDVEQAQAEAEVNRILAESVTPEYIKYRELRALDAMATSDNKIFMPVGMIDSVASQVALGNARK